MPRDFTRQIRVFRISVQKSYVLYIWYVCVCVCVRVFCEMDSDRILYELCFDVG